MNISRACLRLACASIVAGGISAAIPYQYERGTALMAQSAPDQTGSVELEQFLFVQAPEKDLGGHSIVVVWLPQPLQRLCVGKTSKQCSTIDYCIRTTNRESSQCRDIGVDLARIPKYAPGTRPRRMHSVVLSYLSPDKFPQLQGFYRSAPKASLERISMSARIKARVRYTWKPDDDDFDLLEVLAVSPF